MIENSTSNATLNSKARRKIEYHFDATLILKTETLEHSLLLSYHCRAERKSHLLLPFCYCAPFSLLRFCFINTFPDTFIFGC